MYFKLHSQRITCPCFICLFWLLGLHCCGHTFASFGKRGLLIAVASLLHSQALGAQASVVVAHQLSWHVESSCQGRLCPLHWQEDSYPLCHQEVLLALHQLHCLPSLLYMLNIYSITVTQLPVKLTTFCT